MPTTYSISAKNNSTQNGSFCLYQETDNPLDQSLAWLTKRATPNSTVQFNWNPDYSFVQAETGILMPDVIFSPSQSIKADLDKNNMITLTAENGKSTFADQRDGVTNMLSIQCSSAIKSNQVNAGIGISGFPALLREAVPNLEMNFNPQSKFRLAFGNFRQGELLDTNQIFGYVMIDFQLGIPNYKAIYNPNETWNVQPV